MQWETAHTCAHYENFYQSIYVQRWIVELNEDFLFYFTDFFGQTLQYL